MKKYKRWKRVYTLLIILFTVLMTAELLAWLVSDGEFPFATLGITALIFGYRSHHLNQLKEQAS
ncbi:MULTISPECIES: hypothetical protein [Jeotgalibacillus]|uniref:hypothetical protein n=1 Tax=Jeotgalibacillus TaxID=157226 RepID=UPI00106A0D8A|nr:MULTISPECIES: hypothetical protein [Jeotgalibacillus]TFD99389.1 hypothetical protein E2491_07995 [Jeotgalibacillus sp. R-1-5s-1]